MTEQRPIGYWLKLVDRLVDEQFENTLDEHGVTRRQWQLLTVLAQEPATVEKLDAMLAPPPGHDGPAESSMEHLAELIDSGWVHTSAVGFDITERGRTAVEGLTTAVHENRLRQMDGIAETEYLEALGVLERIARNLGFGG